MITEVRWGRLADNYKRYIGPLAGELHVSLGMNQSTHVASIAMDPNNPGSNERAVVKVFNPGDKGWFNELFCWTIAQHLSVKTPPRAAILVGEPSDLTPGHGAELNTVASQLCGPFVLWCTSAVEPSQNIQTVLGKFWQQAILRTEAGQRVAAMDAWLGNCDRIAENTLWWGSSGGGLVAIDHEKAAFNQDWATKPALHLDEVAQNGTYDFATYLLSHINKARRSKDRAVKAAATKMASLLCSISEKEHMPLWPQLEKQVQLIAAQNFGTEASDRLVSFLAHRVTVDAIKRRCGVVI